MKFTAAAAVLAVLSSTEAASFFKSSPSVAGNLASSSLASSQSGWFHGTDVRGGATGEFRFDVRSQSTESP